LIVDVARHAGQADILREMIDGEIGYTPGNLNLPPRDAPSWAADYAQVEVAGREAAGMDPSESIRRFVSHPRRTL